MRADRLISLLLIIQSRGKVSAGTLAEELEVSERTIYRDIDALTTAGIPVYGEPGPDGGYALLDNYRTRLTGLTESELRALFLLDIPEPLIKLGIGQELKTALLKLSTSLNRDSLVDEMKIHRRIYLDSAWWQQEEEPAPHLRTLYRAVMENRRIDIRYRMPFPGDIHLRVEPYGLVAKAGDWYLVYAHQEKIRARRVLSLTDVSIFDDSFERPADFNLTAFWQEWCRLHEEHFTAYTAFVRIAPDFLPIVQRKFGESVRARMNSAIPDPQGYLCTELPFETLEAAREFVLACGRGVEVLEPIALRASVIDFAEQTVSLYVKQTMGTFRQ
ncbi:MAG: WYL domain-containing protein [Dehalococcoidales bacterium]|nr:WYL domain-containing protein [Dehalococcoidales bacterium]